MIKSQILDFKAKILKSFAMQVTGLDFTKTTFNSCALGRASLRDRWNVASSFVKNIRDTGNLNQDHVGNDFK